MERERKLQEVSEELEKHNRIVEILENVDFDNFDNSEEEQSIIELQSQAEEIFRKFNSIDEDMGKLTAKIIGQMYNGVLVKSEVSVRRGKVFHYRHQYEPNMRTILRKLEDSEAEVRGKLGERFPILKQILTIAKIPSMRNEIQKDIVINFEPLTFVDRDSYGEGLSIKKINAIEINSKGGITWVNSEATTEFPEHPSISREGIIFVKFYEPIMKALNEVKEYLATEYEKSTTNLKEIERIGGEYLILANLKNEEKQNG